MWAVFPARVEIFGCPVVLDCSTPLVREVARFRKLYELCLPLCRKCFVSDASWIVLDCSTTWKCLVSDIGLTGQCLVKTGFRLECGRLKYNIVSAHEVQVRTH